MSRRRRPVAETSSSDALCPVSCAWTRDVAESGRRKAHNSNARAVRIKSSNGAVASLLISVQKNDRLGYVRILTKRQAAKAPQPRWKRTGRNGKDGRNLTKLLATT